MFDRDLRQGSDVIGATIQCGDVAEGAASRLFEDLASRDVDLLEGFVAVGGKTGTHHVNSVDFLTFLHFDRESEPPRVQLYPQAARFIDENVPAEREHALQHARYFVGEANRFEKMLDGPDQSKAIIALKADIVNYRTSISTLAVTWTL